jgi:hypothetical protein
LKIWVLIIARASTALPAGCQLLVRWCGKGAAAERLPFLVDGLRQMFEREHVVLGDDGKLDDAGCVSLAT